MSMKLMVSILETIEVTRPQQAVLIAMAENANDDGSHCFPSVDLIAWKAGYKVRNVVDIMRELRNIGVLEVVNEATQRRPTEYHIHLDKAPKKLTFEEWKAANGRHRKGTSGVQSRDSGVQSDVPRGAVSREVQSDEGCNLTSLEVHSHGLGVQSHVKNSENARENAPEPVNEPVKRPSQKNLGGEKTEPRAREPAGPIANATRIPDDFAVTTEMRQWAIDKGGEIGVPPVEVERLIAWEIEKFRNYWRAKSKDNTKRDWPATWRVWMQKELEGRGGAKNVTPIAARRGNPDRAISTSLDPKDWTGGRPLSRGGATR